MEYLGACIILSYTVSCLNQFVEDSTNSHYYAFFYRAGNRSPPLSERIKLACFPAEFTSVCMSTISLFEECYSILSTFLIICVFFVGFVTGASYHCRSSFSEAGDLFMDSTLGGRSMQDAMSIAASQSLVILSWSSQNRAGRY